MITLLLGLIIVAFPIVLAARLVHLGAKAAYHFRGDRAGKFSRAIAEGQRERERRIKEEEDRRAAQTERETRERREAEKHAAWLEAQKREAERHAAWQAEREAEQARAAESATAASLPSIREGTTSTGQKLRRVK